MQLHDVCDPPDILVATQHERETVSRLAPISLVIGSVMRMTPHSGVVRHRRPSARAITRPVVVPASSASASPISRVSRSEYRCAVWFSNCGTRTDSKSLTRSQYSGPVLMLGV